MNHQEITPRDKEIINNRHRNESFSMGNIIHWPSERPSSPPSTPSVRGGGAPPAEMSSPVDAASVRNAGARYDGNNPTVVLQWEARDAIRARAAVNQDESVINVRTLRCFGPSCILWCVGQTEPRIYARLCFLRGALVNLPSSWFELKTSPHKRNNVNLPASLM